MLEFTNTARTSHPGWTPSHRHRWPHTRTPTLLQPQRWDPPTPRHRTPSILRHTSQRSAFNTPRGGWCVQSPGHRTQLAISRPPQHTPTPCSSFPSTPLAWLPGGARTAPALALAQAPLSVATPGTASLLNRAPSITSPAALEAPLSISARRPAPAAATRRWCAITTASPRLWRGGRLCAGRPGAPRTRCLPGSLFSPAPIDVAASSPGKPHISPGSSREHAPPRRPPTAHPFSAATVEGEPR